MAKFEELPENVRALILAKLAAEMATHKSTNIHQLARSQKVDIAQTWRSICRKAGQPVCTMSTQIMKPA